MSKCCEYIIIALLIYRSTFCYYISKKKLKLRGPDRAQEFRYDLQNMGKIVNHRFSMGAFCKWLIYVHLTLVSPVFVSKWQSTWPLRCKIVFQTTFLQKVLPKNAFFCRKTWKTVKKFLRATVDQKNIYFQFFKFSS